MLLRPLYLFDADHKQVAALNVIYTVASYQGTASLEKTPPELRELFKEYEEIVLGQMFSLLDSIEAKVAAQCLKVAFEDGTTALVENLQVFPSTAAISFQLQLSSVPTTSRVLEANAP